MNTLLARLGEVLREPTCLARVGNPLRSDDGVGVYLARRPSRDLESGHPFVLIVEDIPEAMCFRSRRPSAGTW